MNRKETTEMLSTLVANHIGGFRKYWASEVTFDYNGASPIRVDFISFEPENQSISGIEHGIFKCFEVKSCREDFKSKNGHNFIGDKNYYVMTMETYEKVKTEIPWGIGVYIEDHGELKCIKNAARKNRTRPLAEMLFMMLRSGQDARYTPQEKTIELLGKEGMGKDDFTTM